MPNEILINPVSSLRMMRY